MRGIFTYLQEFKESEISWIRTKYSIETVDIILRGHYTAQLISLSTSSVTSLTATQKTWTINDVEYKATRITGNIPNFNEDYVIKVNGGVGNVFYDGIFNKAFPFCNKLIFGKNDCSNEWYDWDSDQTPIRVEFTGDFDLTEISLSTIIKIDEGVEKNKNKASAYNTLVGTMPRGYAQILQALATCDTIKLGNNEIVNTSVSNEDVGSGSSTFTFKFQEKKAQNDTCCEIINIDEIDNDSSNNAACNNFTVDISENNGTLTATAAGTVTYKWYKSGSIIGTAATATVNGIGTYKVEAKNQDGCKATATINIVNECLAIIINPFQTGNDINANVFNAPSGYTIAVKHEGSTVATSLPYTGTVDGVYYIEVITSDCKKIAGFDFKLQDEDCNYTLSITRSGDILTAVTTATTPTIGWELQTMNGTTAISGNTTTKLRESGLYIATVNSNGCVKKTQFLYIEDQECMKVTICNPEEINTNPYKITERFNNVSGQQFTLTRIDLTKVNNPNVQLKVTLNGIDLGYESGNSASEIDKYVIVGNDIKLHSQMIDSDLIIVLG